MTYYRLVNAPAVEAAEIVEKLAIRDQQSLRLTLFSLQKYIRVSDAGNLRSPALTLELLRKNLLRVSF